MHINLGFKQIVVRFALLLAASLLYVGFSTWFYSTIKPNDLFGVLSIVLSSAVLTFLVLYYFISRIENR